MTRNNSEANFLRKFEVPYRMPDLAALGGACTKPGVDPDIFCPAEGTGEKETERLEKEAKEICETVCPAKAFWACREWVVAAKPPRMEGVMGGLTKKEREAIYRNNLKKKRAS